MTPAPTDNKTEEKKIIKEVGKKNKTNRIKVADSGYLAREKAAPMGPLFMDILGVVDSL